MFLETTKFELNFHRKQYLVYVMSGVTFILFFLAMSSPNVEIGGGNSNVNLNAAMAIVNLLGAVSFITMFVSIAFTANSVVRDYDLNTIEFFLSRPYSKFSFIYGRYVGSLIVGFVVYLAGLSGVLLGELMPWLDPERIGPTNLSAYVYGTLLYGLPNLLIFSSIFFFVSTITRSLGLTYATAIGLVLLGALIDTFTERATVQVTSMLDPFGSTAVEQVTRYWTSYEQNVNLPAVEGALLQNRFVWLALAAGFLAASYWLFPTSIHRSRKAKEEKPKQSNEDIHSVSLIAKVQQHFDTSTHVEQFWSQTKLEIRSIVFSIPFAIVLLLGMLQVVGATVGDLGNILGTSLYPTTSNMVAVINGAFSLPLLVVLIYMSAEMMGRERTVGINELMDAMPFPNWIMIAAKWLGLAIVVVVMLIGVMLASIGVQVFKGFGDIDVGQYLVGLFFFFQFPLYLMVTLSIFFYVMSRNKYMAMFLMLAYVVAALMLPAFDFQHYLYRMNQPNVPHSDFTGYGHNLDAHLWLTFYWGLFGCLLLLSVHLFWQRGIEDDWANRLKVAKHRLTRPVLLSLCACTTAFVLVGGFIFYNTNVLNTYRSSDDFEVLQADYEKTYKQFENLQQLEVIEVYADIDIYPEDREVMVRGYYQLLNKTDQPITELHVTEPIDITVQSISLPEAELIHNERLNYRIYKLAKAVQPGEGFKLQFEMAWLTPGFANFGHSAKLASNGTFFNNADIFPLLGYQEGAELQNNNDRRQYDLPPIERMPDLDDEAARYRSVLGGGDRVKFETVVSTSFDQTAIAPGYLQKEWQEGERRYFHYKMDAPIWNVFSFMSGDYELTTDQWQDVAIEVYHLHDYNVATMIESTQDSLEYFSNNFSPYQYRQFRILEFPKFQGRFAQAFPNTIPFSEAIGFTADLRDQSKLDYAYYVTAHELAHQWWAHQVLGAGVQGSTLIIETLAQYSALMVMEQKFGRAHMQRFLSFELDSYLRGRGSEIIEELPLYRVENQPYIHYRKGSVVFYSLKDLIGEDAINDALSAFIQQYAFKGAPYPTTRDLLTLVRARAAPEHQDTITDLFERIVLFDLQVNEVEMTETESNEYRVSFDVSAKKYEAAGEGKETEIAISDWIDVGVLGEENSTTKVREIIHLEKVLVNAESGRYSFTVKEKPYFVGIDPLNKLVDRNPDDNVKEI